MEDKPVPKLLNMMCVMNQKAIKTNKRIARAVCNDDVKRIGKAKWVR